MSSGPTTTVLDVQLEGAEPEDAEHEDEGDDDV